MKKEKSKRGEASSVSEDTRAYHHLLAPEFLRGVYLEYTSAHHVNQWPPVSMFREARKICESLDRESIERIHDPVSLPTPFSSVLDAGRCNGEGEGKQKEKVEEEEREREREGNKRGPDRARLLAIRRSPRNRISIGTVITELRFGFVVILNDLFVHGHLLHPPLPRATKKPPR